MSEPVTRTVTALTVGHATHDRYGEETLLGGSAYYAAVVFDALGADVSVATAVGEDFRFLDQLHTWPLFRTPSSTTTTFENTYPTDGPRLMLVENVAANVSTACLPAKSRQPDVLFLAPVVGEVEMASWLQETAPRIAGAGLQGFLKTQGSPYQGPVPVHLAAPHVLTGRAVANDEAVFNRLSAVFMSEEDLVVAGDPSLPERLRERVGIVAVTDGEKGAVVHVEGEGAFEVGVRSTTPVDPTGAGDTFASAFLYGLASGMAPVDGARFGAAAASIMVEGHGAKAASRLYRARSHMDGIPVRKR